MRLRQGFYVTSHLRPFCYTCGRATGDRYAAPAEVLQAPCRLLAGLVPCRAAVRESGSGSRFAAGKLQAGDSPACAGLGEGLTLAKAWPCSIGIGEIWRRLDFQPRPGAIAGVLPANYRRRSAR